MTGFITASRADIDAGRLRELRELAQERGVPLYVELPPAARAADLLGSAPPAAAPGTVKRGDHRAFLANLDGIAAGKVQVVSD